MRYFVTSDDAPIANRICDILTQLRQECPVSHVLRLDAAVPALESAMTRDPKSPPSAQGSEDLVLVVLPPDTDRGLAVVRELRRRTSARVLAIGPATDTKLVLRAIREGAAEYLDQKDLPTELSEALQRLQASKTSGRIIGLLAPCGGSGSSTLAVNVATVLAQKSQRCALVDLKLEAGDLAPLLDLKPNHTLADLCQNFQRLDHSLIQGCLARCESGVQLLAAPARLGYVATVTAEAVEKVLSLISQHFPFVVLDLDHTYRAEQRRALLLADVIVLVLRLDFISLRNTRITLDWLQENGVTSDKIRFVANRFGEPSQLSTAQVEESLGFKFSLLIPDDPKSVNRAANNGIPVVLQSPSAKVSRSMIELAMSLMEADRSAFDQGRG